MTAMTRASPTPTRQAGAPAHLIGIDIDNVIASIESTLRRLLAQRYGCAENELQQTSLYRYPFLPAELIGSGGDPHTHAATCQAYANIWDSPELITEVSPTPQAPELMHQLSDLGLLAGYITRRPEKFSVPSRAWLRTCNFPAAPLRHAYDDARGRQCKSSHLHQLGAGVLIDDHPAEIESVIASGIHGILLSAPHNRDARISTRISRAHTLKDAVDQAVNYSRSLR